MLLRFRRAFIPAFSIAAIASFAAPVRANPPEFGTVEALTPGDLGCYVDFIDDTGRAFDNNLGVFELCERNLVGKRVRFAYDIVTVQSAACEGDPECTLSETIPAIVRADPIGPQKNRNKHSLSNRVGDADLPSLEQVSVKETHHRLPQTIPRPH